MKMPLLISSFSPILFFYQLIVSSILTEEDRVSFVRIVLAEYEVPRPASVLVLMELGVTAHWHANKNTQTCND